MTDPHYADDSVTLYAGDCLDVLRELPDCSVDAVVTDPPYGLGFMGKGWDDLPPGLPWAIQCLRVLKPGGHLLAFGGTRTWHRLACAVEDAGFEMRDSIAWLYGSGFPKSRDVTAAMERFLAGEHPPTAEVAIRAGVYEVTAYLRAARIKAGLTNTRIDALFGTNGMAGHWTTAGIQPAVPSVRQWATLRDALGFGDEMDALVSDLAATERPEAWGTAPGDGGRFLGTLGAGGEYEKPGGWGTALKPAFEPVVVARKPTRGTTTHNVAVHGTGGLNIDGCRVGFASEADERESKDKNRHADFGTAPGGNEVYGDYSMVGRVNYNPPGRWPANVVLDESQAAELDRQSGVSTSPSSTGRGASVKQSSMVGSLGAQGRVPAPGDTGGASRFFPAFRNDQEQPCGPSVTDDTATTGDSSPVPSVAPDGASTNAAPAPIETLGSTFRYEAKAPTIERPRDGEVAHPTVKPLDLMRWLVRLVTPPGGVVLEPFAGSGTTVEACIAEGVRCIAIEREADYLPLILHRIERRRANPAGPILRPAAPKPRPTGALSFFDDLDGDDADEQDPHQEMPA